MSRPSKPVVLIPACTKDIGAHPYHAVQKKYVDAVLLGAECTPILLPPIGMNDGIEDLLDRVDGIMLTGSPSNVHPSHFAQEVHNPALPLDPARDATTLPLIKAALARGLPLFGVCRGFQEINVALGGTLHQAVQEVPGMRDHREDKTLDLDAQYAPVHSVSLLAGGLLQKIFADKDALFVNSLHGQGVDMLAPGLRSEAIAEDGLIEAYSVSGAKNFALAVQWHPEWQVMQNPDSLKIYQAFGDACRQSRIVGESRIKRSA
ncbi:MAG: gamma-glutamyl-gamma-aminobutyrate hydrolase family protein [Burkholderiales bacterium]